MWMAIFISTVMICITDFAMTGGDDHSLGERVESNFKLEGEWNAFDGLICFFHQAVDVCWRIMGCDTHCYSQAKKLARDSQKRFELILAIVVKKKFPLIDEPRIGLTALITEMILGLHLNDVDDLIERMQVLAETSDFANTFHLITRLDEDERGMIIKGVVLMHSCANRQERTTHSIQKLFDLFSDFISEVSEERTSHKETI